MVTIYCPELRMFETPARKVESYFEKLNAIKEGFDEETSEFLCKVEDADRFRQEPILVTEYCNQGNLWEYMERRKVSEGWLREKEINLTMYILALAIRQMRELGVSSIHTICPHRIMIKDKGLKLREPGLVSPSIEGRLAEKKGIIDYFAP